MSAHTVSPTEKNKDESFSLSSFDMPYPVPYALLSIVIAAATADGWHGPTVRVLRGAGFPSFSIAREGHAASNPPQPPHQRTQTTNTPAFFGPPPTTTRGGATTNTASPCYHKLLPAVGVSPRVRCCARAPRLWGQRWFLFLSFFPLFFVWEGEGTIPIPVTKPVISGGVEGDASNFWSWDRGHHS